MAEDNKQPEKREAQELKITKKKVLLGIVVLIIIFGLSSLGWWKDNPLTWFKNKAQEIKTREKPVYPINNENDQKQYDYLLESLEKTEDYPDLFEPWVNLGRAKSYFKDYDGAIAAYNKANEISPKNTLSWNNLAQLYIDMGNYGEAERCMLRLIENKPTETQVYVDLSYIYEDGRLPGKEGEADKILLSGLAVEDNQTSSTLMSALAAYYERQHNYAEAIKWYEKMLAINPDRQATKDKIERLKSKL